MSGYCFISIRRDEGTKVKSYKTASRAKATIVSVEIEVTDAYALGDLLRQLHDAKHPPKPNPEPSPKKDVKALPAPPLQLADLRRRDL